MFGRAGIPRGAQNTLKSVKYPAPTGGINTKVAATQGDPRYCINNYNFMPFEFGLQLRYGYREYQIEIDDGSGISVNTIVPYEGLPADATDDRIFAVTNEGIWDVSTDGGSPTLKFTFADQSITAGYGVYAQYTDNTGVVFLFYADSLNGLFRYDPATDTWAQATGITGPVITNIKFVVVHKQRMWLIEEDSASAWYLPVGSASGNATEFEFGSKFRHGGNLVALYNWSVDGGAGVDDYLVAVSRGGDVLPYQGQDPSSATSWSLRGTYYIGSLPQGNRIGSEHGGDLYLLSEEGVVAMSDLLQGVNSSRIEAATDQKSAVSQIIWFLRILIDQLKDLPGWSIRSVPSLNAIIISSPQQPDGDFIQLYFNEALRGWCLWRGVPINCFEDFKGRILLGTKDLRVCRMDRNRDNVKITPPSEGDNGEPVPFSIISSFLNLDAQPHFKQVQSVRGDFVTLGEGTVQAHYTIRYDFDAIEGAQIQFPPLNPSGALWDSGIWDTSTWAPTIYGGEEVLEGSWGRGRRFAITMRGRSDSFCNFIGWDVLYRDGGLY